jgi:hypothetical protein
MQIRDESEAVLRKVAVTHGCVLAFHTKQYIAEHGGNPANLSLYGQEMNLSTWAICKMNMFLHGIMNADIATGDTIREPKHTQGGELLTGRVRCSVGRLAPGAEPLAGLASGDEPLAG